MLPIGNWVNDYLKINEIKNFYSHDNKPLSGENLKIAVIDNGINENDIFNHVNISKHLLCGDIAERIWNALKEKNRDQILNELPRHCEFNNLKNDFSSIPASQMEHGTEMAAYISSEKGICTDAELIVIKAIEDNEPPSFLPLAIYYAIFLEADIINLSLGSTCTPALQKAIKSAYFHKIPIICAAGNSLQYVEDNEVPHVSSETMIESIEYPAAYQRTIAIGGYDQGRSHYVEGDRGRLLDFMAPAVNVPSLLGIDDVPKGTSIAAAITSGIIGLFFEKFHKTNNRFPGYAELKKYLSQTAFHPEGEEHDIDWGYGIIRPEHLFQIFN